MRILIHLLFLGIYLALSYFWFVAHAVSTTVILWGAAVLATLLLKFLRPHFNLLIVVGAGFGFLYLSSKTYWLAWPIEFYVTTIVCYLILRFILREKPQRLKWSLRFSKAQVLSIFLINVPSVLVLYWYYINHPEVAATFPSLPGPLWAAPAIIIGAALVNGLREEIFYRGLLQPLSATTSPAWYVISLQAVLFGFLHYYGGFPQGWLGVGLTGLWGAALAIQYHVFRSISLAWVTHAIADAVMFAIILYTRK